MKPKLLDLFCGAGGAAMGYHRAGFEVVGVDIKPQKHFPFEFHQADAMTYPLEGFDVIHASPPCQRYSRAMSLPGCNRNSYPDLIDPCRERLKKSGVRFIIENVEGSPLVNPLRLCGSSFGLMVRRHRLFETGRFSITLFPPCSHGIHKKVHPIGVGVKGREGTLSYVVSCFGHSRFKGDTELRKKAMGVDWMSIDELSEAIPPAYTEWIGRQIMVRW